MDAPPVVGGPAMKVATAQPVATRPAPRADFADVLHKAATEGMALEAPFRAPPPVDSRPLPPAGVGHAARGTFGAVD